MIVFYLPSPPLQIYTRHTHLDRFAVWNQGLDRVSFSTRHTNIHTYTHTGWLSDKRPKDNSPWDFDWEPSTSKTYRLIYHLSSSINYHLYTSSADEPADEQLAIHHSLGILSCNEVRGLWSRATLWQYVTPTDILPSDCYVILVIMVDNKGLCKHGLTSSIDSSYDDP